jgi:hypothetical protein
MVFYFNTVEVDALEADKKQYFERLFRSRKLVKSLYNLDVFYGERGSDANYNYWQRVFGTWYDNVTTKGIFRLIINDKTGEYTRNYKVVGVVASAI